MAGSGLCKSIGRLKLILMNHNQFSKQLEVVSQLPRIYVPSGFFWEAGAVVDARVLCACRYTMTSSATRNARR